MAFDFGVRTIALSLDARWLVPIEAE